MTLIVAGLLSTLLWTISLHVWAEQSKLYPAGIRQIEFRDGERHLALAMFYPAEVRDNAAPNFNLPFFVNLHLYKDADIAGADARYPLVMFSHGRGSNPLQYAWCAETLASHGYIVAAPYHYRANTYDSTIAYLAKKLWQRPLDISFDITALLNASRASASMRGGSASQVIHKAVAERDYEASFSLVFALAAAPSSCMVRGSPAAGAEAPNFLSRRFMYLRKR
jgi:Platelet-activating factor acetylhydrolase, isoform II